ncbi:hypothetical protein M407DRAFT_29382 [Tulasnella calospora MUT 4182]|uniref:Uncharacterized protein n=1 Tax=Tulasnella calospora MUT 4182 TaxID=1051891 RepID=A0A0C3PZK9_9AGAM|nr:hypothetical protein M407DRAFT_29382 [Tulasnella calospora MUT 4182]
MQQPNIINHVFPPELLASVFDILYGAEQLDPGLFLVPSEEQMATHFRCHPLLNAMLVCKAWYSLIKTTPKYWTSIAIGVGGVVGWGAKVPQDIQEGRLAETLEEVLQRSAQLPIQVSVVPDRISDLEIVTKALNTHARRLTSLSLLGIEDFQKRKPIPVDQIGGLLNSPFPALERFVIGPLDIIHSLDSESEEYTLNLAAPNLRRLACNQSFISPHSTSQLTHLSLTDISSEELHLGPPPGPVELPQLLELHLSDCDPGEILPTLFTPALLILIVSQHDRSRRLTAELSQYANLRELQWSDVGQEECFEEILELSPNLTRYSNYVFGTEEEVDLSNDPATILRIVEGGRGTNIRCPKLKEVCLDIADGAGINRLVTAFPSIQFLRILRDPIEFVDEEEEKAEESRVVDELRRKVDWTLGQGLWRSNGGAEVNVS